MKIEKSNKKKRKELKKLIIKNFLEYPLTIIT
jgi:hypothetical protein